MQPVTLVPVGRMMSVRGRVRFTAIDDDLAGFHQRMVTTLGPPLGFDTPNGAGVQHNADVVSRFRLELMALSRKKVAELQKTAGKHKSLTQMLTQLKKLPEKMNVMRLLNGIVDYEHDTSTQLLARSGKTRLFDLWRHMASISLDGVQFNQPFHAIKRNEELAKRKKQGL